MISTSDLARLSERATSLFLAGDSNFLGALRDQYASLERKNKKLKFDGYGYFEKYSIDVGTRILNESLQNHVFSGIDGVDSEGEVRAGLLLFVQSGMLIMLEGFPGDDDSWPSVEVDLLYEGRDEHGKFRFMDHRTPEMVSSLPDAEIIVTKQMLDDAGGVPLPGWPPLADDA